eukprot:jgi/Orpsp1_1/1188825/evm.model.d7180000067485.1
MYKLIIFFIIFYFQFIRATQVLSKEEVLKIKNQYFIGFYCKDDICVPTKYDYRNPYVEIPDKNGTLIKYIAKACTYDEIELNECTSALPINCTVDSECLSNKCFKNYC